MISIFPLVSYPSETEQGFTLSDFQQLKGPSHFQLDMYGGLNSLNLCLGPARSSFHKTYLFNPIVPQEDRPTAAFTHHKCNSRNNWQTSFSVSMTASSYNNTVSDDLSAEHRLISFISDSCFSERTQFLEHFLHTLSIFTQAVATATLKVDLFASPETLV